MQTAFVDTVSSWGKKENMPLAIVLVSQLTGKMLVIPKSSQDRWKTVDSFDRIRKIKDKWYTIDKSLLKKYEDLADWLIKRQQFFLKEQKND